MLGKIYEVIREYQQDMSSAADNKEYYDKYQRFFKSPPYEKTSVFDFMKKLPDVYVSDFIKKLPFTSRSLTSIRGRLGGCLRNLRDKVEKRYAKSPRYLSGVRKDKINGN